MIPIPPSQWVNERQKSMDFDRASTSVSMVDPVVEKPEHISKKASAGFGMFPDITSGTPPITDARSQASVTKR